MVRSASQAPRSLWDPTYSEPSWITFLLQRADQAATAGAARHHDFDPGTKMAISEYNFGGTNHISGGIARRTPSAIFGQQGLFSAAFGVSRAMPSPNT